MNHPRLNIAFKVGRKMAVLVLLVAVSAIAALATLGDGKSKPEDPKKSLLTTKPAVSGTFSLRSGYSYRGSQVINNNTSHKYVRLNTVVTVQKGNVTYTVPLKKNVILDKVKIDLSNRQFKSN